MTSPVVGSGVVLDASAVLAVLFEEEGAAVVARHLIGGCVSAVNHSEVLARAARRCDSTEMASRQVDRLRLTVVPFDAEQAVVTASLVPAGRPLGLSLADRACLALGLVRGRAVLTADRAWAGLDIGVAVEVIR